jgi:hypothetical protein
VEQLALREVENAIRQTLALPTLEEFKKQAKTA